MRSDGQAVPRSGRLLRLSLAARVASGHGIQKTGIVEDVPARLGDMHKQMSNFTGRLVQTIGAPPIGDLRKTSQQGNRPVDNPKDLSEHDLRRLLVELVPSELATFAVHEIVVLEVKQDLLKKLLGNQAGLRQVGNHYGLIGIRLGEGHDP